MDGSKRKPTVYTVTVYTYIRIYLSSACNEIAFHFYAQNVLTFLVELYRRYEKPYILFVCTEQLPGTCLRRSICGTFLFPVPPSSQLDWNQPPPPHRVPKGFSSSSQGFLIKFPRVSSSSSQKFFIKSPRCSICFHLRLILCVCIHYKGVCAFIMGSAQYILFIYFYFILNCDGPIKVGFSIHK